MDARCGSHSRGAGSEPERRIERLALAIAGARRVVFFTGAGISTESGLPDFRGPDGVWTRRDKGLPPPSGPCEMPRTAPLPGRQHSLRKLVWHRGAWSNARPNAGHMALVDLLRLGKLDYLVSQNVDNLHIASGIPLERLAELHGNGERVVCTDCARTAPHASYRERVTSDPDYIPACDACGGAVKSSVVNFGDTLPVADLREAERRAEAADVLVVAGSSLVVTPAADIPRRAKEHGAWLAILNAGETPLDPIADLRFFERLGDVLPPAVERVRTILASRGGAP